MSSEDNEMREPMATDRESLWQRIESGRDRLRNNVPLRNNERRDTGVKEV